MSFLTIGVAWIDHNALTDRLDHIDTIFLRLNLLFLLLVAFLPYPTRLASRSLHGSVSPERVATVVYGMTLLAIQLMFFGLDRYCRRERAGSQRSDARALRLVHDLDSTDFPVPRGAGRWRRWLITMAGS